jgi:rRNA maturation protein Nop10
MGTQLKQQLLDYKEYQDAVKAGDKDAAKASKLSLKGQIGWWNAPWNKQRLRSDKEYQDAVKAGDKDAAKVRKIHLGGEIIDEKLREEGRECRDLGKPFCAWCMYPDHRMEFVEGEAGEYVWEYRNKDGSKDMRVNDNSQSAVYTSEWLCKECGANTTMKHYMRESPSKDAPVYKVTLKNNGSGNRIAEDWESDEGTVVDGSEAHRKGDN